MGYHIVIKGLDIQTEIHKWAGEQGYAIDVSDARQDFEIAPIDSIGGFYIVKVWKLKVWKFVVSTMSEEVAVLIKLKWSDAICN